MSRSAASPSDHHHADCCPPSRADGVGGQARVPTPARSSRLATRTASSADVMVELPGGRFEMGTNDRVGFPADGEGPVRQVTVSPFSIDRCAMSNDDFAAFVDETGYVTEAERFGWSYVFAGFLGAAVRRVSPRVPATPWWLVVHGATWRSPEGARSDLRDRGDHPVVHVSWRDAAAFAHWAGKRLPTEAEWEYAARGGLEQARYPWGDELQPGGEHRCNIWQGNFPVKNTGDDGWLGTAPADAFPPNGFGMHNMAGNVWEWCADWWSPTFHLDGPRINPRGPQQGTANVMRGGSYMCHESYCNRYRVAARSSNTPDSSTGHIGFRCVRA